MLSENLSSKNVLPITLTCPTCARTMTLTSITPASGAVIYGFLCDSDGDHLSWRHPLIGRRRDVSMMLMRASQHGR